MNKLSFLLKPLLIVLVFILALWLIAFLNQPSLPSLPSFSLSPGKGQFKTGQEFKVDLVLNAKAEINAADTVLSFDPNLIEVAAIQPGQVFPLYPRQSIDPQKGEVQITGVKTIQDNRVLTTPKIFATLILKAKKPGTAKLNFIFNKGKTTGSTIIKSQGSENILEKVEGGKYEIKSY